MSQKFKSSTIRFARMLLTPRVAFVVSLIVVLSVLSIRVTELYYTYDTSHDTSAYNSDDAAQSNILYDWQHGDIDKAVTGTDSWFLKFPLYAITNNIPISPINRMLLNALSVTMIASLLLFAAYAFFARMVIHDNSAILSVCLYCISFAMSALPGIAFGILKSPNSRNIELGIAIMLLVAIYANEYSNKYFDSNYKLKAFSVTALATILFAEDPLFVYMFGLPILATCIVYLFLGTKISKIALPLSISAGGILFSVLLSKLVTLILPIAYIKVTTHTTPAEGFSSNFLYLTTYGPNLFGIFPWNRTVTELSVGLTICYCLLFMVEIFAIFWAFKRAYQSLFYSILIVIIATSPLVLLLTTFVDFRDHLISRYMILTVPVLILGIPIMYSIGARLRQFTIMLCLTGLLAVTVTLKPIHNLVLASNSKVDNDFSRLAEYLKPLNVTKGYSQYEFANITTYMSGQSIKVLPVMCIESKPELKFYHLLVERAPLYKLKSNKSFYIYYADAQKPCTAPGLIDQLGVPNNYLTTFKYKNSSIIIAVYDYDIGKRLKILDPTAK